MTYARSLASILFIALALALQPHRAAAADPIIMKIGTATINDQQVAWMNFFKQSVERNAKGRIDVQLYPASQLGSTQHEIEGTQFGSIQGWVGAAEFLSGVDPRYQVLSAPGLFSTPQNAQRTLHDPAVFSHYATMAENKGLVGIGLFFGDEDAVAMRKPVRSLADFSGTKIRVLAGAIELEYMHQLGASGVPMPLDQVSPALQQGAIDGVLEGITTAAPFKHYGVAKYLTEINQTYYCDITVISKTWFDALPADLQKIVLQGGKDADNQTLAWDTANRAAQFKAWTSGGGELITFEAPQKAAVNAVLAKVAPAVFAGNAELLATYHLVQSAAARNR
jgi:TRAP-type transport system periplasmic protein